MHQLSINLSDNEYNALAAKARSQGTTIEYEISLAIRQSVNEPKSDTYMADDATFLEYLFRSGIIDGIPTGEMLTDEEEVELDRLARVFSGGKMASEIVIEDRGPW